MEGLQAGATAPALVEAAAVTPRATRSGKCIGRHRLRCMPTRGRREERSRLEAAEAPKAEEGLASPRLEAEAPLELRKLPLALAPPKVQRAQRRPCASQAAAASSRWRTCALRHR